MDWTSLNPEAHWRWVFARVFKIGMLYTLETFQDGMGTGYYDYKWNFGNTDI